MSNPSPDFGLHRLRAVWAELSRRRVVRVLIAYGVIGLGVLQAADLVLPGLGAPAWVYRVFVLVVILGLPAAAALAWAFDLENGRLVRTAAVAARQSAALSATAASAPSRVAWLPMKLAIPAAVLLVAAAAVGFWVAQPEPGEAVDSELVAIFPFRVAGADPGVAYLSEGVVDLLAAALSGEQGRPRPLDPGRTIASWRRLASDADPDEASLVTAARSLAAGRVLLGQITGSPQQLAIRARLVDVTSGAVVTAEAEGALEEIGALVDRLAVVLLSRQAGESRERLALLTSTSLAAVREFLYGQAAYRRSNFHTAAEHYQAALDADSTFALAALGVELAGRWPSGVSTAQRSRAVRLAWQYRDRLSAVDAVVLRAVAGRGYPEPTGDATLCEAWFEARSLARDRAELWHQSADCWYHYGAALGITDYLERAASEFRHSLALDSTFLPNVWHLIELEMQRGDTAEVLRLAAHLLRVDSTAEGRANAEWWTAVARNDSAALASQLTRLERERSTYLVSIARYLDAMGMHRELADSAVAAGTRVALAGPDRTNQLLRELRTHLIRGRSSEALAVARTVDAMSPASGSLSLMFEVLYGEPDDVLRRHADSTRSMFDDFIVKMGNETPPLPHMWDCLLEQFRLWEGDASRLAATLHRLENPPPSATPAAAASARMCAVTLQAIRAGTTGSVDALRLALKVDSIARTVPRYSALQQYLPFIASRLFERAGETQVALQAVQRRSHGLDVERLIHARLRETGRLAAATGDAELAIAAYRHYLALRDPAVSSPYIDGVRTALAELTTEPPARPR